jgi:metallo-beta-lactamase class B
MRSPLMAVLALALLAVPAPAPAQKTSDQRTAWNQPFEPFHIIDNLYYVGASGVSSYLITTKAGSILLDGGLPETAPLIESNIRKLGFRLADVKYLLNSHAHYDHAGGLAALKRKSHATLVASRQDAPALRQGTPDQPALVVDRELEDGDVVKLGGTVLTAHITPGHTKGCTTWTMSVTDAGKGKAHPVVFYCSTSVVDRLVGNAGYPQIAEDYQRSFPLLRALPCDIFLAPHPDFFQMASKRERMLPDAANPFVDATELRRFVDASEQAFLTELQKQRAAP